MAETDWRKVMLIGLEAMSECCGCNPLSFQAEQFLRKHLSEAEFTDYVRVVEGFEGSEVDGARKDPA